MQSCDTPTRNRRRFQFRLRTLLLVTTLSALVLGWFGYRLRQAREQRESLAALRAIGADIAYAHDHVAYEAHYFIPVIDPKSRRQPPGPVWLRRLLGADFFDRIVEVRFRPPATKSASLVKLKGLTSVERVVLTGTSVTDDGMVHLKELKSLRGLFLTWVRITDAGLAHLQGLANLEGLDLGRTRITDKGLECLRGLKNLRVLCLEGTAITDAGLEHLKDLPNLEEVHLFGTRVTDRGIGKLKKAMPTLRIIREERHRGVSTFLLATRRLRGLWY